jgi:hypothetical protein
MGRNVGPFDIEHGVVYRPSVGRATHVYRIYPTPSAFGYETQEGYVCHAVGAAMTVLTLTSRFALSWMVKVIRTYLSRNDWSKLTIPESNGGDITFKWSLRDRIMFAMILVLCSVGSFFLFTINIDAYRRQHT